MELVEVHIIKSNHKYYNEADLLCFLSKNLYNSTNYAIRQHYIFQKEYLNYNRINKIFTDTNQHDYRALPAKVAKGTQRKLDKNWKLFFKANKEYKNNPEKFTGKPKIPKYLDKFNGRYLVHYEKGALSFVRKKGYIHLSQTNIYIKSKITKDKIIAVDIVPCKTYIKIIVIYKGEEKEMIINERYASCDLGLDNLATVTSNVMNPIIINGKPLKSINQYANKKNAELKSYLDKGDESYKSKLSKLWLKRNNKITDYMHKASTYIVNQLVSKNISKLVIGKNKFWKQDINIGKKNNQNFVSVPFLTFTNMLEYKCKLKGIEVIYQEESYTSRASFLNEDFIPTFTKDSVDLKKYKFSGRRIHRGLYKIKRKKIYINADVNGSLNILRKYLTNQVAWNNQIWLNCVEQCSNVILKRLSF